MKKLLVFLFIFFPCISLANNIPTISGKNAIAIEVNSGRILYEKNGFNKASIASTTKIMTLIVALENNLLDDTVVVSKKAAWTGGSSVNLKEGDKIKLSEILYGLMLNSGNDAAVAIAEHTAGNLEEFAKLMNEKAKEIGALNTNFVTPHGLDTEGHYSTAYDMAIISKYALQNPIIAKIVSTQYYTMHFLDGKTKELKNTNPLLSFYEGISGMKTGYTGMAGRCLIATAKRNDLNIIVVTLGEPSSKLRINDTVKILDYCFNNYKMYDLRELYPINFSMKIKKSIKEKITPIYKNSLILPLLSSEKENIIIRKYLTEELIAPIEINQHVGKIQFKTGNEVLGEIEICSPYSVNKTTVWEYYNIIFSTFLDFNQYIY